MKVSFYPKITNSDSREIAEITTLKLMMTKKLLKAKRQILQLPEHLQNAETII